MQFGVGLLGAGWTVEGVIARLLDSRAPAHPNFHLHADCYAAKVAAETVLYENPTLPDLSDEGIVRRCAGCARPVRMSEAPMVRAAFLVTYGAHVEEAA